MDAMMQACQKAIGCMLFEGVEQAQTLHLLQTYAQLQTFEKGQIIYSPGHYQHSLGIIVQGRTVVEKECGVLLNDLGAGQCFGAAALFVPQDQYVTTVRAKTGCSILFLSMEQMRDHRLQLHPLSVRKNPVFKPQNRQLHRPRRAAGAALLSAPAARRQERGALDGQALRDAQHRAHFLVPRGGAAGAVRKN